MNGYGDGDHGRPPGRRDWLLVFRLAAPFAWLPIALWLWVLFR